MTELREVPWCDCCEQGPSNGKLYFDYGADNLDEFAVNLCNECAEWLSAAARASSATGAPQPDSVEWAESTQRVDAIETTTWTT